MLFPTSQPLDITGFRKGSLGNHVCCFRASECVSEAGKKKILMFIFRTAVVIKLIRALSK